MSAWLAWTRKELRDYRALLLGIAIAVPVLIAIGFFAFADKLTSATSGALAFYVALVVTGLFAFSIAGDAVASEFRRNTIGLVRRQPKGMLLAWLGKLTALALAFVALTLITQGALSFIWGRFASDTHAALRANAVWSTLINGSSQAWLSVWIVLPVVAWTLMVSAWIGKSGAAPIAALVLLGAVLAPLYLWFRSHPWAISFSFMDGLRVLSMIVAGIGLLCATIAWFVGRSHCARPWRSVVASGTVFLGLLGTAVAFGAVKHNRWLDIRPTDAEFRVYSAVMGANESSLWVSVYKGDQPYIAARPVPGFDRSARHKGTPLQTWHVNLSMAAYESVGDGMQTLELIHNDMTMGWGPLRSLTPTHGVRLRDMRNPESHEFIWFDANTGQSVTRLTSNLRDGAVDRLQQKTLRHATWLRDANGRRVWIRDRRIEREGEEGEPVARAYALDGRRDYKTITQFAIQGFVKTTQTGNRRRNRLTRGIWFTDGSRVVPSNQHALSLSIDYQLLNERQSLVKQNVRDTKEMSKSQRMRTLNLVNLQDAEETRIVTLPPRLNRHKRFPWMIVDKNQVLTIAAKTDSEEQEQLVIWNPTNGDVSPLDWADAPYAGAYDSFRIIGRDNKFRFLIGVRANRYPHRTIVGETLVLLNLANRTLRVLSAPSPLNHNATAILRDGSVVVIEDRQRIVRLGPAFGAREQLFPFPN